MPSTPDEEFERLFGIPPTHRLVAVRSRVRGGALRATYWEHKEFTPDGRLRASYRASEEVGPGGRRLMRWTKIDASGRVERTIG